MIKIEKNVPLPSYCTYPFKDMEVGDSFVVPLSGTTIKAGKIDAATHRVSVSAGYWVKKHSPGAKFTIRSLVDEGVARCWRVK